MFASCIICEYQNSLPLKILDEFAADGAEQLSNSEDENDNPIW